MKEPSLYWSSDPPTNTDAKMEEIDRFDARGMHRVYGRGDHYPKYYTFNMDIWMTRNGRLLMRCWSNWQEIDGRSFEIKGLDTSKIPKTVKGEGPKDSWVPDVVRNTYEEWVWEEF